MSELICIVCCTKYRGEDGVSYCCDVCGRCGFCFDCADPEYHDCEPRKMPEEVE